MIKKSIILLASVFFFAGCAERGSTPKIPLNLHNTPTKTVDTKDSSVPTLVLSSSREDTMQKNISGSLILIIGLLLLL